VKANDGEFFIEPLAAKPITNPTPPMSTPVQTDPTPPADSRAEQLSAALDGQADAIDAACAAWRSSPEARRTWHAYHLIGDTMRSSELAQAPARDAAFLQALRARMAQEPVVLAPPPRAMPAAASRWWVPAAAAAGFVAVAGVVAVARQAAPLGAGPELAAASVPASRAVAGPAAVAVIRDERLDEFLRAHQATRGGMGAALPGGAIRRVELEATASR
jgi:sigma-E factor negative regulatory protein RseA